MHLYSSRGHSSSISVILRHLTSSVTIEAPASEAHSPRQVSGAPQPAQVSTVEEVAQEERKSQEPAKFKRGKRQAGSRTEAKTHGSPAKFAKFSKTSNGTNSAQNAPVDLGRTRALGTPLKAGSSTASSSSHSASSGFGSSHSGAGGGSSLSGMINLSKVADLQAPVGNVLCSRKQREFIPDSRKDDTYWDRRRKNNEAAKRSREKRRISDLLLETRVLELTRENALLHAELYAIKEEFGLPPGQHYINPDSIPVQMPDLTCRARRASVRSLVGAETTSETGSTSSSIISTSSSTSSLLNSINAAAAAAACQAAACQTGSQQQQHHHHQNHPSHMQPTSTNSKTLAEAAATGSGQQHPHAAHQQLHTATTTTPSSHLSHLSSIADNNHHLGPTSQSGGQSKPLAAHLIHPSGHLQHLNNLASAHNHHLSLQQQQTSQLDHQSELLIAAAAASAAAAAAAAAQQTKSEQNQHELARETSNNPSSCLPLKLRHKYKHNSSSLYC